MRAPTAGVKGSGAGQKPEPLLAELAGLTRTTFVAGAVEEAAAGAAAAPAGHR